MSRRALHGLLGMLLAAGACRRDVSPLDEVQKAAYAVKPGVVRVNALATAEFRYTRASLEQIERQLAIPSRVEPQDVQSVPTGAGGSGSGFIVHPDGFIVTSGHVVAPTREADRLERDLRRNGAIAALVKHFPVDELRALYRGDELDHHIATLAAAGTIANRNVVNQVELSNGEALPFTIRRFSPPLDQGGRDLAVLKVERRNLPSLPLGDSEATRVGQSIWAVGYPAVASSTDEVIGGWLSRDGDLEATFNPGIITSMKVDAAKMPVFQSNVAIYQGNSGGPAVNLRGEVIGVSTWGHSKAESIKFLLPVNVARSFLQDAGVAAGAGGEFNQHYRAALDAAAEGRWIDAKPELLSASRLFPNSPDLIRFRRDTDRALGEMPVWRQHPAPLAGAALLVVGMITAMTFSAMRVRRPAIASAGVPRTTAERLVSPSGASSSQPALGRFTILNGEHAGERLGLGGSGIRIGREGEICEIVLENPKVSRLHAEVVSIDGKVLLIDRNSSNGTYVNDRKIEKQFLEDGDIIYFGGRNAVAVAFHA